MKVRDDLQMMLELADRKPELIPDIFRLFRLRLIAKLVLGAIISLAAILVAGPQMATLFK